MNSVRALLTIAAALTLAACEEEPIRVGAAPPTPDAPPPPAAVEEVAASTVPAPELRDEDFVETDRNRIRSAATPRSSCRRRRKSSGRSATW